MTTQMWKIGLVAILAGALGNTCFAQSCFGEVNGNIVIQAERTSLTAGWVFTTEVPGYSGSGAIKWIAPNQYKYQGKGILRYNVCASGGLYNIRGAGSRPSGLAIRRDEGNDFYIKVGNEMVKLFTAMGTSMGVWKPFTRFDRKHVKSMALIQLPRGCSAFTVAGRSEHFIVDKIKLVKTGMNMTYSDWPQMVACTPHTMPSFVSSPISSPLPSLPEPFEPSPELSDPVLVPSQLLPEPSSPLPVPTTSLPVPRHQYPAKPKCPGRPSQQIGPLMIFKLESLRSTYVNIWTTGITGIYTNRGGLRPGSMRAVIGVTQNTWVTITDWDGNCLREIETSASSNMIESVS